MIKIKVIIPIIIIIIIISTVLITFTPNEGTKTDDANNEISKNESVEKWIRSGPFEIDKSQYNVGEKIFLSTINLLPEDNGVVQFFRPINDTHHKAYMDIPFDGMAKSQFNYYFQPMYDESNKICSMNDIAGNWVVKFSGTQYQHMNFKILNQTSSWDDRTFEPIC